MLPVCEMARWPVRAGPHGKGAGQQGVGEMWHGRCGAGALGVDETWYGCARRVCDVGCGWLGVGEKSQVQAPPLLQYPHPVA